MSILEELAPHDPVQNGLSRREGPADTPAPQAGEERTASPLDVSDPPAFAFHDLKTRNRSTRGDRESWSYSYSIPTADADEIPLEHTPLLRALDIIEAVLPGRAATLHHFYNRKLGLAQKWHKATRREEEEALARRNTDCTAANLVLDEKQEALRRQRDEATRADREALAALDEPLMQAHQAAAEKVAGTGGLYDPNDPAAGCVLRHTPRALEEVAADLGLPGPHGDARAHMVAWLGWFLAIVVGAFIGTSLGIITHVLHADCGYLTRHWPITLLCAVLGVGFSAAIKQGTRGLWYLVGQDLALAVPARRWRTVSCLASAGTLAFLVCDAATERQGLLALVQLDSRTAALSAAGPAPASSLLDVLVPWCIALLVTIAYLTCAGVEGYLKGRQEEVLNLARSHRQAEFTKLDAETRMEARTQDALHALSRVREILHRHERLRFRIAETAAPFEQRLEVLEAARETLRRSLDESALRRVQDALDDAHGAQGAFDGMFEEALEAAEAQSGFWHRLLNVFTGYRPPHRSKRDPRVR